jgi:phospholipid/cholesterol/gamma-HCH transport system substrate-binding protein
MGHKFHPFERAVGFFIIFALLGSGVTGIGIAIHKKWFEDKNVYAVYVSSASNIRVGSSVLMAGLKVGAIESVDLDHTKKIKVTFNVLKKYSFSITEGAKIQFIRPFVIGDKVLTIIQGELHHSPVVSGTVLPMQENADLMDLVNGGKIHSMISKVDGILNNIDETLVIGKDLALQVSDKKKIQKITDNVLFASTEIRKILPHLSDKAPTMAQDLQLTMNNLKIISQGLKELQPEGSKKTVELLNESVIVLQAMQKSFFLRSHVEAVKSESKSELKRLPANE